MCVIFVATTKRPTEEMIEQAFNQNPKGGGIAYRDTGHVVWKKGLDLKEMIEECAKIPMPFVAHFRIPTCGGELKSLCHPFPIDKEVSLSLEGRTKGLVLFHNGHWTEWRKMCLEAAVRKGARVPDDKWSDSRAMAWFAAHYGLGSLDMIDEKCVVFGPNSLKFVQGIGGFSLVNDVLCSNTHWQRVTHHRTTQAAKDTTSAHDKFDSKASEYSDFHGGRFSGTLCRKIGCTKYRWGNAAFCHEHLPKVIGAGESGGASNDTAFRQGSAGSGSGSPELETVQETESETRGQTAKGVAQAETAREKGTSFQDPADVARVKVLDEALKWAKSLNPKVVRSSGGAGDTVLTRH